MRLRNLKTKFIIYLISFVICIALLFLTLFIYRSNRLIKEDLMDFGFHLVKDLSYGSELAIASEDPVLLQPFFEGTFGEKEVVLATIYNKKGEIIASKRKIEIEERMPLDVMEKLLKEKEALQTSCYTPGREEIYCFYSPVLKSEIVAITEPPSREIIGFVGAGLSLDKLKNQIRETTVLAFSLTLLFIFFGVFISVFLAENLAKSVGLLRRGTEAIAKGNLDYQITIKTGDEIELLANEFNSMTQNLKRSRDELQQRIEQLERFQKLTIGRELRMGELKKEIEKLKEELGK